MTSVQHREPRRDRVTVTDANAPGCGGGPVHGAGGQVTVDCTHTPWRRCPVFPQFGVGGEHRGDDAGDVELGRRRRGAGDAAETPAAAHPAPSSTGHGPVLGIGVYGQFGYGEHGDHRGRRDPGAVGTVDLGPGRTAVSPPATSTPALLDDAGALLGAQPGRPVGEMREHEQRRRRRDAGADGPREPGRRLPHRSRDHRGHEHTPRAVGRRHRPLLGQRRERPVECTEHEHDRRRRDAGVGGPVNLSRRTQAAITAGSPQCVRRCSTTGRSAAGASRRQPGLWQHSEHRRQRDYRGQRYGEPGTGQAVAVGSDKPHVRCWTTATVRYWGTAATAWLGVRDYRVRSATTRRQSAGQNLGGPHRRVGHDEVRTIPACWTTTPCATIEACSVGSATPARPTSVTPSLPGSVGPGGPRAGRTVLAVSAGDEQ